MLVEALNWNGMGHAEYAAALGLSLHALRIWRDRLEETGDENGLAITASSAWTTSRAAVRWRILFGGV